jgi:hypothetical protein
MLNIEKKTRLDSRTVVDRAVAHFGPDGLDLEVVERGDCCVRFRGGGGFVLVQTEDLERGSKRTKVVIQGREHEFQIREFLRTLR